MVPETLILLNKKNRTIYLASIVYTVDLRNCEKKSSFLPSLPAILVRTLFI